MFLPLCVYDFVVVDACIPTESFYLCCFITASLCVYARLTSPFVTRRREGDAHNGGVYYLNVNLAYEMWRDVPIKIMHACDGQPVYLCESLCYSRVGVSVSPFFVMPAFRTFAREQMCTTSSFIHSSSSSISTSDLPFTIFWLNILVLPFFVAIRWLIGCI